MLVCAVLRLRGLNLSLVSCREIFKSVLCYATGNWQLFAVLAVKHISAENAVCCVFCVLMSVSDVASFCWQHPFSRLKGEVQCVQFHPTAPHFFVAVSCRVFYWIVLSTVLWKISCCWRLWASFLLLLLSVLCRYFGVWPLQSRLSLICSHLSSIQWTEWVYLVVFVQANSNPNSV